MRILGITIPEKKRLEIALTALYGVGRPRAQAVLKQAGIEFGTPAEKLTTEQETALRTLIEKFTLEGDLRREVGSNIKRLKDIRAYRGIRHMRRLPVRGQRTKTNTRTVRGNLRKTMGSGKKKEDKK